MNRPLLKLSRYLLLLSMLAVLTPAAAEVTLQATPDNGLQPLLMNDADGHVHLLYFKKRLERRGAREGSLFYRQYDPDSGSFGQPVRVSSSAFNLQTFAIARAGMSVGGDGRIHVIWYLSREGKYFYARSNPERTAFEEQRDMVSTNALGIDAGANVAAGGPMVAILWGAGDLSREHERTVFTRMSTDFGATFGPELAIGNPDLGACACCSLAGAFDDSEDLVVAYRSAIDGIGRHMQLLTVKQDGGVPVNASYGPVDALQQWELSACPLSTNSIQGNSDSARWLVFETEARIVLLSLNGSHQIRRVAEPFTETRQKNPTVAINSRGEKLIAWGEAISHARGGRLNWRLLDEDGNEQGAMTTELEIPEFSFPAAATLPDGNFLLLY